MSKKLKKIFLLFFLLLFSFISASFVSANNYTVDIYFTSPSTVYMTNEMISFKGFVYQANYTNNGTLVSASAPVNASSVNFTIINVTRGMIFNHTFTTDVNGSFYSNSTFRPTAKTISASGSAGDYFLRTEYTDPGNITWFSEIKIMVINKSLDLLSISTDKVKYFASENVKAEVEAIKLIDDRILFVANVSVNGTVQNSSKSIVSSFNCTTGNDGKCSRSFTAPTTLGKYYIELNNFSAFSSFLVVPYSASVYMKDELGKSLKNVYALGEKASVEVSVANASTSDVYTFSGYIADSQGNVVKAISSTTLNSNNSFANKFTFDVDSLTFNYKTYLVSVTVSSGSSNITLSSSFEVKDWVLSINKKEVGSGFEYEYSTYPNKTLKFEAYPKLRSNGTIINDVNISSFSIILKDELNDIYAIGNVSWNASCSKNGCYEFSLTSPLNLGKFKLDVSLSHQGVTQTQSRTINIINGVLAGQSTNSEGSLKELFGTNEFVYLSLKASNATSTLFNLSDAEISSVVFMNGSEVSYTKVNNFTVVNATNGVNEWAFNITSQLLKLDVPKFGGVYDVFIYGNNKSVGALARFIVRPYESCTVAKDTAGTVGSGNYYVWQFKTGDTVYFEIKIIQANNPLGRATVSNFSSGNSTGGGSYGKGAACSVNTGTQQVINNATLSIVEVSNSETGSLQNINSTDSVCQASDSTGGYSCTLKPLSKWEGGNNIVKFKVIGQDGTEDSAYGRFEARAFYLYGWSSNWQNSPSSNVTLNVRLYEAGSGWWGSSGGLGGTITLKRVEYMGSDGDWIWPPVDSGFNVSNVSSASVTSGSGSLNVPVSAMPTGQWKNGYYRAVIQGTTSNGDSDYGYAWFGVKLWDVYGTPIECSSSTCNYKNYFNSRENISLYIKISQAGNYNYNYAGGEYINGNVSIGVKKISDCRTWPCKELNSSQYAATTIYVNSSSKWYWNANINNDSAYILKINTTSGTWGTGYYSVVLNVNGTDTGNAWFNTVAFYVDTRPSDENASSNWKTNIKSRENMYYNVTVTRNYKGWGASYNATDFVNATIDDAVLRAWDSSTFENKVFNYPEDINVSIVNRTDLQINGSALVNISYKNGSWPTGYYWGEITLKNNNETSSGWVWFSVQPFRVSVSTNTYNIPDNQCVNSTISIFEPYWYSNVQLTGNYSILEVYENIWTGSSNSRTSYTNFTNSSFTASQNITVCPNNADWGGGSWGGYHYLNIKVRDNSDNATQEGWLSFKSIPFSVGWGSVQGGTGKTTNVPITVQANVSNPLTGAVASGNLSKVYQWRWDNTFNGEETFVFNIGNCWSNVSGQCNATVQDWSGIYVEGRETYNGYFSNSDSNGYWKYDFGTNENITIRVYVRDVNYSAINVNITNVQYALSGGTCYSDWCLSYTSATWGIVGGGIQTTSGNATLTLKNPSGGWTKGDYYIKATVSGSGGTGTIKDGRVRVKDFANPNVTISTPLNFQNISNNTFSFTATTIKNAQCSLEALNYDTFHSWRCGNISQNSNNGSLTAQKKAACNLSAFAYNGSKYYYEYINTNYRTISNGTNWFYSSGSTGLTTGGTSHSYTFNVSNWSIQNYGVQISCWDSDYNSASEVVAFNITKGT
ncbi:hypothetical protein HYW75_04135 [Candidatus Pacearchaeota archaeon]|nr:hypothetical protein [Candidatus Pacearchaeota archaeon]